MIVSQFMPELEKGMLYLDSDPTIDCSNKTVTNNAGKHNISGSAIFISTRRWVLLWTLSAGGSSWWPSWIFVMVMTSFNSYWKSVHLGRQGSHHHQFHPLSMSWYFGKKFILITIIQQEICWPKVHVYSILENKQITIQTNFLFSLMMTQTSWGPQDHLHHLEEPRATFELSYCCVSCCIIIGKNDLSFVNERRRRISWV